MLPTINDKRWIKLLKGEIDYKFKCIPASLIVSRLHRKLKKNYNRETLIECLREIYIFFKKFEAILIDDINEIFK